MQQGFNRFAKVGLQQWRSPANINSMMMGTMGARRTLYVNPLSSDGLIANTSNKFIVMKDTEYMGAPNLQLVTDGPSISLQGDNSLQKIES